MKRVAIPVLAGLLLFGGGVAVASIPASSGVINGCYKNNGGDLKVIDSAASCPTGYTPLNWDKDGGLTSPGVVQQSVTVGSNSTESVEVYCPSGKVATGGGGIAPSQDPDIHWALQRSYPVTDGQQPIGWNVQAHRYGAESTTVASVTVYAICATP